MTSPYKILSSRIAYENRWTRVREDRFRQADGTEGLYGVVERADFVVIVPYHDNCVTLVQQYRYPVSERVWEFPMGMWEHAPGTDPAIVAAGELREETGLAAASILHVGEIFQGPGYCTQRGHIFLATGLHQGAAAREPTEQDMVCRSVPVETFERMVRDGEVREAMTISAFGLLRIKGLL